MNEQKQTYPVVIIGAGPVGLAAAAHLVRRGEKPLLFEAGASVGASMLQWGHVRLFSPWRYVVDQQAQALLAEQGWQAPDPQAYPTGREIVEQYLFPLSQVPLIKQALYLQTQVRAVSRVRMDKVKTSAREETPFVIRIKLPDGEEQDLLARAVIDASGTYQAPNPLGAHGLFARGEQALREHIFYGIPDVLGPERTRYAGKRVLVVGSGHSAQQTLLELAQLARQEPATRLLWAIRRPAVHQMFGGGTDDALPERGQLGVRSLALIEQEQARLFASVEIQALRSTSEGIIIAGEEERIGPVDEIIATTGFRPDLSLLRELRVALDPSVESPVALAPLIDPNIHSCGTVPPHGVEELAHPEQDFYIVGMKSYGRAPTFLMLTGYEQVRSIVAALCNDWEAARSVELVLPETGVCSTDLGGSCCTPAPSPLLTVGVKSRPTRMQKQ
jgi:thioredoxin reductase